MSQQLFLPARKKALVITEDASLGIIIIRVAMNDHGIKWHRWYGNLEMFFKTKALVFNLPKKAERIKARHSENIN